MKALVRLVATVIAVGTISAPVAAVNAPVEWDGLRRVASKRMNLVYVQPGADFRGYSKVIVEPTEVAFHKDWRRNYNSSTRGLSQRISEQELQKAVSRGVAAASEIFTKEWAQAGYQIVDMPAADVLRVKTAILNISVNAPERNSASHSYTFSDEAGRATLVIEARDSQTGALLGRAVDQELAGDSTVGWRTSAGNRADFRDLAESWARDAVRGFGELQALSTIK